MLPLIDAHTHLNTEPLFADRRGYLQKFVDVGGRGLINSGASESYNVQGIEIAKFAEKEFPSCIVKTTLGWHPLECVENTITADTLSQKMQRLKQLYSENAHYVVAIGETGLDLHYPNGLETLDIQKHLFVEHCTFAREIGLPLVVHSRDAFKETLEILKAYPDLTIYFHCRGYGPEEFKVLNATFKNLFVGFCGNVTYKKAEELRETLNIVPLDHLLLETDAPYLTPQVVRGQDNHPANVRYIYDYVSDILHIEQNLLSHHIEENFMRVYRLS